MDNTAARNAHRRAADAGRRAAESAGVRGTSVSVVVETYVAAITNGATPASTVTTVLSPRPKVRAATDKDGYFGGGTAAASDGVLSAGGYVVGPITLPYTGGGYSQEQLCPAGAATKRVYYLLEGDEFAAGGEKFRLLRADSTRPHQTTLMVERTRQ